MPQALACGLEELCNGSYRGSFVLTHFNRIVGLRATASCPLGLLVARWLEALADGCGHGPHLNPSAEIEDDLYGALGWHPDLLDVGDEPRLGQDRIPHLELGQLPALPPLLLEDRPQQDIVEGSHHKDGKDDGGQHGLKAGAHADAPFATWPWPSAKRPAKARASSRLSISPVAWGSCTAWRMRPTRGPGLICRAAITSWPVTSRGSTRACSSLAWARSQAA